MNIPNFLTTIRFILIPIFIAIFYSPMKNNIVIATYIFILAGITDVLDGYIARKYDMITKFGTVLDPLADKLMLITVLICFTDANFLPIWVILVVGLKEITMILGGIFLYYCGDKTVIPANKYGKVATVSFYIAILSIAFHLNKIFSYALIILAVIITIIAFINYVIGFNTKNKNINIDK
ncbi:MAG: CDP-diacylglycerol--glycerol-3-phosphate 3-phosphatidyltransferase [Firmicutes bacterium]|nr:CDP-diacylglycerol--glycerol-3-phosphate 3-phosphatidyltransferase [Bacillota bacterium]MTI69736.1 CDP-diacylglycerol--glycerol-3-phosphate 3-phosphatidyltransferase [Bacillota bacterium]